jgi:D-alanyl-D-alanine carboxypeptidase/D-alanyl-D-alanine-endopeptidase (penicillin-binding protein 4)
MNKITLLVVSLFANTGILAQVPDTLVRDRFLRRLDSLENSLFLQHGRISGSIKACKTGETVLNWRQRKAFPSASTIKLLTTATAMAVLNENYTYATVLETDGIIRGDTLIGNVYFRGSGDPSLGSGRFKGYPDRAGVFQECLAAVRKKGIRYVTGAVVADAGIFDSNTIPDGWMWEDLGNYYGAGVSGLNIDENIARFVFRPGAAIGDPAEVLRLEPELPAVSVVNRVTTREAGSGDQVNINVTPLGNTFFLNGTVPKGKSEFPVKGSIPDPARFAALSLRNALIQNGIGVAGGPSLATPADTARRDTLLVLKSPPLKDLARECNYYSINLYAEAFLKTVAVVLNEGNDTHAGIDALKKVWAAKQLVFPGLRMKDGCGLSPQTTVTADAMTDLLARVSNEPYFPAFYESIAVLGRDGTLRNLGKKTSAAGNVRAKSGTIGGVRGYAGYFTAKNGEKYAFAFYMENYDADFGSPAKVMEKLMIQLVDF